MKIISLAGKAGSGKSTLAEIIQDYTDAKIYSFADPIKSFAKNVFEFSDQQLYGPSEYRNRVDDRYHHGRLKLSIHDMIYPASPGVARRKRVLENFKVFYQSWLNDIGVAGWIEREARRTLQSVMHDVVMNTPQFSPRDVLIALGSTWGRELDSNIWVKAMLKRLDLEQPDIAVISDTRFLSEHNALSWHGATMLMVKRGNNPQNEGELNEIDNLCTSRHINNSKDINHLHREIIPVLANL